MQTIAFFLLLAALPCLFGDENVHCPSPSHSPCPPSALVERVALSIPQLETFPALRSLAVAEQLVNYQYQTLSGGALPANTGNGTLGSAITGFQAISLGLLNEGFAGAFVIPVVEQIPIIPLTQLNDYERLYAPFASTIFGLPFGLDGKWRSDVWFGKQYLSTQSGALQQASALPFPLTNSDVAGLLPAHSSLQQELAAGHLYYVDLSILELLPLAPGKYFGGSIALFGSNSQGKFVPLAIRPGSASPVYTPNDNAYEWLFAKIAHNSANAYFTQAIHFLRQHLVWGPVWVGINRQLAPTHPIRSILSHPLTNLPALYPVGIEVLFSPGTIFDNTTALGSAGELPLLALLYKSYDFAQSTFEADLTKRGVQTLPGFTYRDQARLLNQAITTLTTQLVSLYYASDAQVVEDYELQAFASEVATQLRGFPASIASREALAELLAHAIFTTSVEHSNMNYRNSYLYTALPYAPAALYQPLPTTKGQVVNEASLLAFLPNLDQAIEQIELAAVFARPLETADTLGGGLSLIGLGGPASPYFAQFQDSLAQIGLEVRLQAANEAVLPYVLLEPHHLPYWGWV